MLAIALTAVTFVAAVIATPGPIGGRVARLLDLWGGKDGLWRSSFLEFTTQIMLVLVTGHALAATSAVRRVIDAVATRPRSTAEAAAATAFFACATALVNWGLGLIVGALLARQVGARCRERGVKIHYPLVVAAGFAGLMVWHGGLSGSAPLKVTRAADVAAVVSDAAVTKRIGELVAARAGPEFADGAIPLSLTLLSPANLVTCALGLVLVPLMFALLVPRDAATFQEVDPAIARAALEPAPPSPPDVTPADRMDGSRALALVVVALGLGSLALRVARAGPFGFVQRLDLDTINLLFLALGFLLHGSPRAYGRAVSEAVAGAAGIVVQFPLYFGIMGLMQGSGLAGHLTDALVEVSRGHAWAYPLLTMFSAGLLNMFIPSGGGQWAVQGPVVLAGAAALGVDPGKAVLALAYGDQWTNMAQPFWALPLLAICGVRAGDIMGYTLIVMVLATPIFALPLVLL